MRSDSKSSKKGSQKRSSQAIKPVFKATKKFYFSAPSAPPQLEISSKKSCKNPQAVAQKDSKNASKEVKAAPQSLIRVLTQAALAPRRVIADWICSGKVTIDGLMCEDMSFLVDPSKARICVHGKPISQAPEKVYFMLNKPKGYLCTHGPGKRKVIDIFKDLNLKLITVGRLDKDTMGLILVTNDGDFCQSIAHPSNQIPKEYLVRVNKEVEDHHLKAISDGAYVQGAWVKPKRVIKVRKGTLKVVCTDGRKHEVKHLMKAAGLEVLELERIRIGGLQLGSLPLGAFRPLNEADRRSIFA